MKYMLDTNICIFAIREKSPDIAEKILEAAGEGICISSITLAELIYGVQKSRFRDQNTKALIRFMTPISVLNFNQDAADEYGRIRVDLESRGTPIGPLDSLIAAHAVAEDLVLVTHNTKEFRRVDGLKVENWFSDHIS